jgi:hypothetical protein
MTLPFTFLAWGGRWNNSPGFGTVYLNGKPTDLAAVMILTVFGFGFCVYDVQLPESTPENFAFKRGREGGIQRAVRFGFVRFVRDSQAYNLSTAVHVR